MTKSRLTIESQTYDYYDINRFAKEENLDITNLPFSLKILLENLIRNHESPSVQVSDAKAVASWKPNGPKQDIAYHPARVVMQDFTGVPAVVDLAAMRDALAKSGGDVAKINPEIPVDLVIDHSVMVDWYGTAEALAQNVKMEFRRNNERYRFLKWGQKAFDNFRVVPPGTGIVHQVNLEFLAKTIWKDSSGLIYPDTCVGTDSHTTMVNALGVLGWGVGGIEAEAAMLGQPITMLIPEVVGFRLQGDLAPGCTATDLVLTVVKMLREKGVVGKFVEFYGSGLSAMSVADRATIGNMAPEYGATCGLFPIDDEVLSYLRLTGRDEQHIKMVETYARDQGMWRDDSIVSHYSDTLELDLGAVRPSMAGPRRPQDLVFLPDIPSNFSQSLGEVFNVQKPDTAVPLKHIDHKLTHGDVAIAAITSCTNTSNPNVLIAAGLVAKKALEKGLKSKPWVKTSFAPGSQVVTAYIKLAGLDKALDAQGFQIIGYGCTTCIGNSGPLPAPIKDAIDQGNLVTVNVLSGNRNFEGRVSQDSKASYLASPPLVVAYAIAGNVNINLDTDPMGQDREGNDVYLRDIWPTKEEIQEALGSHLTPDLFRNTYADVFTGTEDWKTLQVPQSKIYDWQEDSTYIRRPPFFDNFERGQELEDINGARILAIMPDSTTTDHISPAGSIASNSPAAEYLKGKGIEPADFNSYGSRRGNHEVMMRGTFANIRIKNAMIKGTEGGYTLNPEGKTIPIFDAAMEWNNQDTPLVIIAGKEYGSGSSRDWAAKGPMLQGVRAVIAVSYERIHRSNLVGMGIVPLEFLDGDSAESLNISGKEQFDISLTSLKPGSRVPVSIRWQDGKTKDIEVLCRIDTAVEMEYWLSGGILNYVLKKFK